VSGAGVLKKRREAQEPSVRSHKTTPSAPWACSIEEVAAQLKVDIGQGLSSMEVQQRREEFGANELKEGVRVSRLARFFAQFKSPVVLVLLVATLVSALMGEFVDAIAIVAIVFLNSIIGYVQEAKAEAAIEALKKLAAPRTRLLREGQVLEVPAGEIVTGDILVFEAGDYVAADARIFEGSQLTVDESLLTGESMPAGKILNAVGEMVGLGDRANMIFAGTAVSTGAGKAMVTAIGMETEIGSIAGMLEGAKREETPLQARLEEVSSKLLLLCLGVVVLIGIFGFIHGETWLVILMTAISLGVAAIPEGLPAVVTLALALAIRRMTKRNVIVRHLPSVETLGSTDVICTDKTGTLTTGKMRVRDVLFADGKSISASDAALAKSPELSRLVRSAVLCSNASLNQNGESTGDPTEVALLYLAKDAGMHPKEILAASPRVAEWSFDSVRKRMSVATREGDQVIIHVKGAPESVLSLCNVMDEQRSHITTLMETFSAQGRRLLAIAQSEPHPDAHKWAELSLDRVEQNLTYLGMVAIADPPRLESVGAIAACKKAGIRVVMITGDHPATAKAIAAELGIVIPGKFEEVLTGTDLAQLSQQDLEKRVKHTAVYARVAPEDKLRIVEAWKALGNVVAMTGDGVNDAPALKAASIGISMGRGGTEVARQASSMILADDNFATIVSAVEEGRAIFGNIRRTIQYLLSGNLAEILVMLGAAVAGWPVPLAPVHLLWINLVTDGLPALALAAEPVPKDILASESKPSPKNFFNRRFYGEVGFVGGITAALALAIYGYSIKTEDEITARTHVFSFLVFAELFRSFASRHEAKTYFQLGPRSNMYHLLVGAVPALFQLSLHHNAWFQGFFKVKGLGWNECGILILLTLVPVTIVEIRKLILAKIGAVRSERQES